MWSPQHFKHVVFWVRTLKKTISCQFPSCRWFLTYPAFFPCSPPLLPLSQGCAKSGSLWRNFSHVTEGSWCLMSQGLAMWLSWFNSVLPLLAWGKNLNKITRLLILLRALALTNLLTLGKLPDFPQSDSHTIYIVCMRGLMRIKWHKPCG